MQKIRDIFPTLLIGLFLSFNVSILIIVVVGAIYTSEWGRDATGEFMGVLFMIGTIIFGGVFILSFYSIFGKEDTFKKLQSKLKKIAITLCKIDILWIGIYLICMGIILSVNLPMNTENSDIYESFGEYALLIKGAGLGSLILMVWNDFFKN